MSLLLMKVNTVEVDLTLDSLVTTSCVIDMINLDSNIIDKSNNSRFVHSLVTISIRFAKIVKMNIFLLFMLLPIKLTN